MKTILIEPVSNGWIVRHYQPNVNWSEADVTHVFTSIESLTAELPELLGALQSTDNRQTKKKLTPHGPQG